MAVEPGVQEAEGLEAFSEAGVVEEGDDGGEDGAGRGGAAGEVRGVVHVDGVAGFVSGAWFAIFGYLG